MAGEYKQSIEDEFRLIVCNNTITVIGHSTHNTNTVNAQYNVTKYVDFFYKSVYFEGNAFLFCNIIMSD
jgi:hypothetical protein